MSVNTVGYVSDPPLYYFNGIYYNQDFYTENGVGNSGSITKAYLDATFLRRIGVANSNSTVTNFFGPVTCSQGLSLTGGINCDSIVVSGTATIANLTISTSITAPTITATTSMTTPTITATTSMTSPTITGSTIVNAGVFGATNIAGTSFLYSVNLAGALGCNIINNTSTTSPYILNCGTFPIPTTTSTNSGLGIGWNGLTGGTGESDFINYGGLGGGGGFNFSTITNASVNRNLGLLSIFANGGFTINPACGQLRIQDITSGTSNLTIVQQGATTYFNSNGITTNMAFPVSNSLGALVNVLLLGDNFVSTYAPFTPQSTTAFNLFHPTTSLPLPTLANQYATVGYVTSVNNPSLLPLNNTWTGTNAFNTSIPTTTLTPSTSTQFATVGYVTSQTPVSLLPLNNTWTGTNQFKNSTNGIKVTPFNTLIDLYFGSGTGNQTNLVIGDYRSYTAVTATGGQNIAITPSVAPCLTNSTGNSNIAIGNSCGTSQTLANQNIYIGTTCGNNISTGSNNICIGSNTGTGITSGSNNISFGNSAWPTGNTFSNCTVIGSSSPAPTASNQIILGSTAETVYVLGASQLTNTLLLGTTVVSNNIQVNGNIILPLTISSAGVNITYIYIPPYIIFLPTASMSFTLPAPSASNTGQEFVIRRYGVGGGQTIIFNCVGNLAVWVPANSGPTGNTTLAVSTVWQFRFVSTGALFLEIT